MAMRFWRFTAGLLFTACVGPQAPDGALCAPAVGEAVTFAATDLTRVVRSGVAAGLHPDCTDVSQFVSQCSDVLSFFGAPL
jgi:hypothetical protein